MPKSPKTFWQTMKAKRGIKPVSENRGSAASRGYDRRWRNFTQKVYIPAHPFCVDCLKTGRHEPTKHVHHIVPLSEGGDKYADYNLEGLCASCHSRKPGHGRNRKTGRERR